MIIITAADEQFTNIVDLTRRHHWDMGYSVCGFDLGGTAIGRSFPIAGRYNGCCRGPNHVAKERQVGVAPWKPMLLLQALWLYKERLVWMDADAWCIKRLDPMESDDYDIAVTMRRQSERGRTEWPEVYGYLNAGVVFVNPTEFAYDFLTAWAWEVDKTESLSDQHALNRLVLEATDLTEYNETFYHPGTEARIKILRCEEYNWVYLPEEPLPETKIIHAKKDIRDKYPIEELVRREWK